MPPLYLAAFTGDLTKVRELLRQGADVNEAADDHTTPLMAALKIYVGDPSPRSGPGPLAKKEVRRQQNKLKIAGLLLARGADVNRVSPDGYSALHLAVWFAGEDAEALALAKALIQSGARVDAKLDTGITPLHFAVRHQRPRMARILLDAGADPRLPDRDGETPLQIAEAKGMADLAQAMRDRSNR